MLIGLIILVLLIAIGYYLYANNNFIEKNIIDVHFNSLPKSFDGLKILHVSDFHNVEYRNHNLDLLDSLKSLQPDLIFFTGDAIDSRRLRFDVTYDFIEGLVKIAPVYFVSGNHEGRLDNYSEFHQKISDLGVHVINNQVVTLTNDNECIKIIGLEDSRYLGKDDDNQNDTIKLKKAIEKFDIRNEDFNLCLSHRPEQFKLYQNYPFDLIFSGHAHGGQVRLPFIGGLFAPNQGVLPRYTSGVYEVGRTKMLVSRGLGPSRFPFRINNHPEVILVNLIKD